MSERIVSYVAMGAGAINQRRHLPEIHKHANSKLVALCDPNEARAKEIAAHYDIPYFTDHKEMLAKVDSDAAVVGTPNALHAPQTIDAHNAGRHVLVEKPMATTREDAKAMIAARDKSGKFLMIGMNQRLMPPHVAAKEILDSGKLGKILTYETNFKHPGADGWSVDGIESWFFKKELAGMGVCGDLGIHKADLMRYLTGDEFAKIGGFVKTLAKRYPDGSPVEVDDNAFLECEMASGAIGSVHISWTNFGRIGDNGTRLFCENGVMRIGEEGDWADGVMVDYRGGRKERIKAGAMATNEKQTDSGVAAMLTHSILTNTPPEISGEEGYKALNVVITGIEAAAEGVIKTIG
ncbi:MAG: Gfo/Idh/MocA family oxidoreductase [Planctomycetota bacterium]